MHAYRMHIAYFWQLSCNISLNFVKNHTLKYETINYCKRFVFFFWEGEAEHFGGEASLPPPLDRTLYR